jgi:pimeloyl-ACP methyl ester carboxylesterase
MTMNRRGFGLSVLAAAGCATTGQGIGDGPIDEGAWTTLNGVEQWVAIRGKSTRNPVLLFLHGGPGIGIATSMPLFDAWTEDFTVVLWDQPGGGATAMKNLGNPGELSPDRYARDGVALAEQLRKRFGKRKIVLMGISWGTHLGVEMAHRRPDLFSVYVGTSQTTGRDARIVGYQMAIEKMRERGNAAAVAALERVGPPPYSKLEDFLVRQQYTNPPFLPMSPVESARALEMQMKLNPPNLDAPYVAYRSPPAGFDMMKQFMDTQRATQAREDDWDIRDFGLDWPMPIFVFQGENDLNTPLPTARAWLDEIRAPRKAFEMIPHAGHNTMVFGDELLALLRKHVVPIVA